MKTAMEALAESVHKLNITLDQMQAVLEQFKPKRLPRKIKKKHWKMKKRIKQLSKAAYSTRLKGKRRV